MRKKRKITINLIVFLSIIFFLSSCMSMGEKRKRNAFHRKMGMSKMMEGEDQAAFIEFKKSLDYVSDDKESLNYIGLIYTKQGNNEKAIEYYKKAIDIDKHYAEAYNNLGFVYASMKQWDKAIEAFDKALAEPLYKTPERALFNKGAAYYNMGKYIEAVDTLEEVLKRSPDFTAAYYYKGLIYLKIDRKQDAIKEFKQAIEGFPDYIEAYWELANIYLRDGNSQKAHHYFQKVLDSKARPNNIMDKKLKKDAQRYINLLKGK